MKRNVLKAKTLTIAFIIAGFIPGMACTNFLITKGASADGSTMISYSADSHVLYGELYHWASASYKEGDSLEIYEWDTGKYLGKIAQAKKTYNVVGNINENQVAIGETTYGGRAELGSQPGGIMDYGSLIYVALQRSTSAREAIKIMTDLVAEYGYYSSGESFSIADENEVWVLEMIGKGKWDKGAVWVAVRIPDGYVSGHANQARIRTFPLNDPENCLYSKDVVSFARERGWFDGKDKDFSFSDTYAPVSFGGARFCDARVWSIFSKITDDMEQYTDYAMGHNLENRMPLYVKPNRKISLQDMYGFMRDYFQDTPLDMTKDIGAGPFGNPYRWRPLTWEVDGETYCNERAVVTQQTGFSFIAQMRSWLPDELGGILWFSVDDVGSTVFVPMYCSMTRTPESYAVGNGAMMEFSDNAAFWVFNQVSNFTYTRYRDIHADLEKKQGELEEAHILAAAEMEKEILPVLEEDRGAAIERITQFSVDKGDETVTEWKDLYAYLFMKYMDGNVKEPNPGQQNPHLKQPGYDEMFYRNVVNDTGDKLKVVGPAH